METEALVVTSKKPPVTASGSRGIVMLHKSGQDVDSQWFEYRPSFFQDVIRIEWDLDTMSVLLPVEVTEVLIRNKWARDMTEKEALAYNAKLGKKTEAGEPLKPKKETEK